MPVVTIQPDETASQDTMISSSFSGNNFGASLFMNAGNDGATFGNAKSLIKFDLSSIPAGKTIVSAILTLVCYTESSSTDYNVSVYRSLVDWFEGVKTNQAPSGGVSGSVWNYKDAIGSVAWAGGAGGVAGSDYAFSPTATTLITSTGTFTWDVTVDVENFYDGSQTNRGWWLVNASAASGSNKGFRVSGSSSVERPKLEVTYADPVDPHIEATVSGSNTLSSQIFALGTLESGISGSTVISARLLTNEFIHSTISGQTDADSSTLTAIGYLDGLITGLTSVTGDLKTQIFIFASLSGSSSLSAHAKGVFRTDTEIVGSTGIFADPSFSGQLRSIIGSITDINAIGYARALHVSTVIGCNPVPLLYITDGSIKSNGQLNLINLISEKNGYKLKNWKPVISQYKDGGRFSSSPLSQGRRLRSRSFDNVIEVFDLSAVDHTQDALIQYQQDLIAFQEAAADYWVSDYVVFPIYLVARAARETNTRYAIIHLMSIPELEDPYQQPFFDSRQAAMETITLRVERGHWTSTPPGKTECVAISSQRSWTIGGWQIGS